MRRWLPSRDFTVMTEFSSFSTVPRTRTGGGFWARVEADTVAKTSAARMRIIRFLLLMTASWYQRVPGRARHPPGTRPAQGATEEIDALESLLVHDGGGRCASSSSGVTAIS